ncbi:MAG: AbrB/MazE/SpoVT family DNA-binding domain-containing protein [Verrucomicrobia bacterium]|nr:AbrB/MazE/SpoVT family DNA-binding domain-containing protein [Verrucomicrobiota bacterium]
MTTIAKLFTTGGSQALRLPKEFRFPGQTVRLRRTRRGIVQILPHDDLEERRARFLQLAGSCPDFPLREPHTAPDLPRDFL